MKAILISIDGHKFLLPDDSEDYPFPGYIIQHRELVKQYIDAGQQWKKDPLNDYFQDLPSLEIFKKVTGIQGFPLSMNDPVLYALDKGIEIEMEIDV